MPDINLADLKAAVTDALVDELVPVLGEDVTQAVAIRVLDAMDEAVSPGPHQFAPGLAVLVKATEMRGTIRRLVESDGELHTVMVAFDGIPGEHPMSPRELEVAS